MNRIKRICALFLASVLILGVALQPGIGGVFAENTEITEQTTEAVAETATGSATEPTTEPPGEPVTEPKEELAEEPAVEPEEADGQPETLPQEAVEDTSYPWSELTDAEFAAWLMDEANADAVRTILTGEGEEYDALNARIGAILDGEDAELAQQVKEYLAVLLGMDELEVLEGDSEYIYFDLAAGSVNIGGSTYTGKVFVNGTPMEVTGAHKTDNNYYIYQSTDANRMKTGYAEQTDYENKTNCRVPVYRRVQNGGESWTDYVTNNTDVKKVSESWETAAKDSDRTSTKNNITFASESGYTANVIIDNIWSTHHTGKNKRTSGGIGANLRNTNINCKNTHITLQLKGDNRVGCVHYSAGKGAGNQIVFSNGEAFGTPGSITVADFPGGDWKANYWSSAIGGADDPANVGDFADGIVINSGVIYAGTTSADDSTAIGGGGNNFGGVTISGGTVTAVTASTGTAIGGGIGWGSQGGDADVRISGGTVYAYNLGIGRDSGSYVSFVPAVAIGGGSGDKAAGNKDTKVTITGGTVYAQSVAGAAIGGGGSGTKKGGNATVNIGGGKIIAKSVGGKVNYNKGGNQNYVEEVSPGVSIGGGTGNEGGGSVTLNVSGGTLRTGSIGGGKTTGTGNIGSAQVEITGGDITGQVIMAGGTNEACTFTMTDGKIHGTNVIEGNIIKDTEDPRKDVPIQYIQKDGGAVWMEDKNGVTNISGGTIESCTAKRGGAIFMEGGTFTLSEEGRISGNIAKIDDNDSDNSGRGGAVFIRKGEAEVKGGSITGNRAGLRGGGLCVNGGNVGITDGLISGNTAEVRGGGVYLTGGTFTMDGGNISDNTANLRGGGIFLTQQPTLNKGVISGNTAKEYGGGLCINGDKLELTCEEMQIYGNKAEKGGGVAVLNGEFILNGGNVGVKDNGNTATQKGGGVFVQEENASAGAGSGSHASVTVMSGNIWYNSAEEGGGVYLDKGKGDFTLNGEKASISHNTAKDGGGIYLYKNPQLHQGIIAANEATGNGGGMYISDCIVTLKPTGNVTITENSAQNGAGIYINRSPGASGGSENAGSSKNTGSSEDAVDAVSSASIVPEEGAGLLVDSDYTGFVRFTNNKAEESGGAVCVTAGYFYQKSDKITVTNNEAANGGGVAVLQGNFTMSDGSIGEENGANKATNGGGVYVSGGEIWLRGGSIKCNEATDGGGAYVVGNYNMAAGEVLSNKTTNSGGGIYVNDGTVTMYGGKVDFNTAAESGGGMYISSTQKDALVDIFSGSISSNRSKSGGGVSVVGEKETNIDVTVGVNCEHPGLNDGTYESFEYPAADKCGEAHKDHMNHIGNIDGKNLEHSSCPQVRDNVASDNGGGFFLNSPNSRITLYCLWAQGNVAENDSDSYCMDVRGGKLQIGDEDFDTHLDNIPTTSVKGNTTIHGSIMVEGGQVDVYGEMENPQFLNDVKVDVKETEDHYLDHRIIREREHDDYKVHYYENFVVDGTTTGLYIARQYPDEEHA